MWEKRKLLFILNHILKVRSSEAKYLGITDLIEEAGVRSNHFMLLYMHYRKWYWVVLLCLGINREIKWDDPADQIDTIKAKYNKLIKELSPEYIEVKKVGLNEYLKITYKGERLLRLTVFYNALFGEYGKLGAFFLGVVSTLALVVAYLNFLK